VHWFALVLDLSFLLVAFGVRTALQVRATADSGWRIGRPHGVAELVARSGFVAALVLLGASLVAGFAGSTADVPPWAAALGVAVCLGAIGLVFVAQLQMGTSWRIGVDPDEQTALVTGGVYRRVRNPIYTGMVAFALGQVLVVLSAWSVAAVAALVVGVELQVRVVEEPYLARLHGSAFAGWCATSGRFLPVLGRA
jgi:protein-S-isoprenylcysteine O-methyltransferase Ste14